MNVNIVDLNVNYEFPHRDGKIKMPTGMGVKREILDTKDNE